MSKKLPITPADVSLLENLEGKYYGERLTIDGLGEFVWAYWDASAPATCAKGDWLFVGQAGHATNNPTVKAAATTAIPQEAGVALSTRTTAGGLWVMTRGVCTFAKVDGGTDVAAADALQLVNGAVYAIKDGGAVLTVDTVAFAVTAETRDIAAQTAAGDALASHTVYILGRHTIIG